MKKLLLAALTILAICGCNRKNSVKLLDAAAFETEVDGKPVSLYTIKGGDIIVQITNFGGRIVSIWTPDRTGRYADVSTGYENIDKYVHNEGERFLGALVGTVANRIGGGCFSLNGENYELSRNNNGNTLHGGFTGIDMLVWDVLDHNDSTLVLSVVRPDGLDGFPGNVQIVTRFEATKDNALNVNFIATTDKATPVNLSCHAFFNLTGDSEKSILGHVIQINASNTTPVDEFLIPTGELASLDGSPLDFRTAKAIGKDIYANDEQLANGAGYDHNFCLDRETGDGMELACTVFEPVYGRTLEVWTDQPGLQFYCGNFFDGKSCDKFGSPIIYRGSIALETQKWPDAIHHSNFPDTVLNPGETYTHKCSYKFGSRL